MDMNSMFSMELKEQSLNLNLKLFSSLWVILEDQGKKKSKNICFLDLELTQLASISGTESNTILEIAICVTDENLLELDRQEWVVSKQVEEMQKLSAWHQNTFSDVEVGGNGLFKDI